MFGLLLLNNLTGHNLKSGHSNLVTILNWSQGLVTPWSLTIGRILIITQLHLHAKSYYCLIPDVKGLKKFEFPAKMHL